MGPPGQPEFYDLPLVMERPGYYNDPLARGGCPVHLRRPGSPAGRYDAWWGPAGDVGGEFAAHTVNII
jgi:hypothetical protein